MLLTITTTLTPATELGYLLHKHPARAQEVALSFGSAHVFYPEASDERCTAALVLDVDPIALTRRGASPHGATVLEPYVNDRPYVASSFLSVAIAQVYGTALAGRCKDRPQLVERPIPLVARVAALPCRGGPGTLERLFGPLGYEVRSACHPLDPQFPEWGESPYLTVEIEGEQRLADLLEHLYVLLPVLDDRKHYWVGRDEVEKLLRRGERWLASHPDRELITRRYLRHQRALVRSAMARLTEDDATDPDARSEIHAAAEDALERPIRLNDERLGTVVAAIRASGAHTVLDLGCGEGRLLRELLRDAGLTRIVGYDVSHRALEIARSRLHLERLPERKRERIELLHGLTYRDRRLEGFDVATLVEVIEHLDLPRLAALERSVFGCARPRTVIVTTPNVEHNVHFEGLAPGALRHRDHRFEWTRAELRTWAEDVAARFGYSVRYLGIGADHPDTGPPTQAAIFERHAGDTGADPTDG